ncbi:hypothetical protein [Nigerium massiliense]|nr:hypothetical protein [Nigerium massiliense]
MADILDLQGGQEAAGEEKGSNKSWAICHNSSRSYAVCWVK